MILELFWRFVVVSMLAFGGGNAALPLVERATVSETGWITAQDFSTAVAFSYITPGPVLILATFVGYRVAGVMGAVVATVGVFLVPWLLAAAAAQQLRRFVRHPWLQGFGRGAGPAVVGLLAVTAFSIAQKALVHWTYGVVMIAAFLAMRTRLHPGLILLGGGLIGLITGTVAS